MKVFRGFLVLVAVIIVAGFSVRQAEACACCSNVGDRLDETVTLDDYERSILDDVAFSPDVSQHTTAAEWEDTVKGMDPKSADAEFSLKVQKSKAVWQFQFGGPMSGVLQFSVPKRVHKFHAHRKPQILKPADYRSPRLYKEWRLAGDLVGNGVFTFSGKTKAVLILHGEGNSCSDVSQFTNWTLDVEENSAQFRFFGRLVTSIK